MPYLPVFLDINVSPVTKVATVTQTANAVSLGGLTSLAVASERGVGQPVSKQPFGQSTAYRSPSCAHSGWRAIGRICANAYERSRRKPMYGWRLDLDVVVEGRNRGEWVALKHHRGR